MTKRGPKTLSHEQSVAREGVVWREEETKKRGEQKTDNRVNR